MDLDSFTEVCATEVLRIVITTDVTLAFIFQTGKNAALDEITVN